MTDLRGLEFDAELSSARALVEAYQPTSEAQALERARILAFIAAHPRDAHLRTCVPGHLTASTILVEAAGARVLLHHHLKLDRWLQVGGGHADGDANLRHVAWRETVEEAGIEPVSMTLLPVDVDVHVIPARAARPGRMAEPLHLHYDVRFVAVAPEGAAAVCSDESRALGWFTRAEAEALELDQSVMRLIDLVL